MAAGLLAGACAAPGGSPAGLPSTTGQGSPSVARTPSGAASPTSPASASCASATLATMTEDQRIGQLFMLGIDGDALSTTETATIEASHVGSVFLVNNRAGGVDGVLPLTRAIQSLATPAATGGVGFFVGADQEGGLVQRLTGPGFSTIPPALEQGSLTPETLQADAASWGRELVSAGVNVDLAPVMDVVPSGTDATNAPIGALQREYGHDPQTAGSHGAAVVRGMQEAGIATTLKHFPGLGRVEGNTDTAAGVVDSVTTADDPYLASFRAGIEAGAPLVMISLATYTAIDPAHQAVFSATVIGDVLRRELGFEGVVASDDLGATASAAAVPAGERALRFVSAGGDLILVEGTAAATVMAAAVSQRAAADPAFRIQIDDAALRVLEAKSAYGLVACAP
jgi:beta-N-acetylhexosaminidase